MSTLISQRCHATTAAGTSCKRWGYADKGETYMCNSHIGQKSTHQDELDVTPPKGAVYCFGETKRGIRCGNQGQGDRTLYGIQFPYGVYLCSSHYKTMSEQHGDDIDKFLDGEIEKHVMELSTVDGEDSDDVTESSPSLSLPTPTSTTTSTPTSTTTSTTTSSRKKRRKWSYNYDREMKPRKRQKSVRCVGDIRDIPHKKRCSHYGNTTEVYRCPDHLSHGQEYRRCHGKTKEGFQCVRVGVPENNGNTYHCHQHSK
jgi:hypothetical protein